MPRILRLASPLAVVLLSTLPTRAATAQKLFGYIDRTGAYVIPPQFDSAFAFRHGVAVARSEGKIDFGLIDHTGTFVVKPKFSPVVTPPPGGALAGQECYGCDWVVIDSAGRVVHKLLNGTKEFVKVHGFKGHVTQVDSGYGNFWLDDAGRRYTPDNAYSYPGFDDVGFSEGLMRAYHTKSSRYGFFNERFEPVVPFNLDFRNVGSFQNGRALVEAGGRTGAIDRTGRLVIKPKWQELTNFSGGLAEVIENYKRGFIDTSGTLVIPLQFDWTSGFHRSGIAIVRLGGDYRIIDRTGRTVLASPRAVQAILDDSLLLTTGKRAGYLGLMDLTGRMITDSLLADKVDQFSEGLAVVAVRPEPSDADRMAAIHGVFADMDRRRAARLEEYRKDSIADYLRKHPEVAAAAKAAADAPPAGSVRYVYYIVRQSITAGTRSVQVGGSKMKMRSVTWYVDYGFVDAKPGVSSSVVSGMFQPPRRSLTLKAGEGVFVLETGAGSGSVVEQAMKRSGVGKSSADLLNDGFMGKRRM